MALTLEDPYKLYIKEKYSYCYCKSQKIFEKIQNILYTCVLINLLFPLKNLIRSTTNIKLQKIVKNADTMCYHNLISAYAFKGFLYFKNRIGLTKSQTKRNLKETILAINKLPT